MREVVQTSVTICDMGWGKGVRCCDVTQGSLFHSHWLVGAVYVGLTSCSRLLVYRMGQSIG